MDDRFMMRGAFHDVPLPELFPFLSLADIDSLSQTAGMVDAVRAGKDTADWEWALGHAVFAGAQLGTPVVLGLDVIGHTAGGDQLEFLLQVVKPVPGRLAVDAAVNVACWCETEHASHDVDALRLVVGEEISLSDAFRAGAERLTGWLVDPRDPDYWRAKAGLPPRRVS
ncbi:hypothetical protein ACFQ9J_32845 [Streptomyces sp. NPDC056529]|uniref:hypothetical protein n=1 Tax=Streptomyces sp. NPDC056529 TaxID=3345855 RepID=UPI0036A79DC7